MQTRIIPKNIFSGKRILGFHKRNLIEGIIAFFIVFFLIKAIPFVPLVRWVLTLGLGGFVFVLNGLGIKGQSLSVALKNYLAYKGLIGRYSYRKLENAPESEDIFDYDENTQTTILRKRETAIIKAKKFFGI